MNIEKYVNQMEENMIQSTLFMVRGDDYLYNKSVLFNVVRNELDNFICNHIELGEEEEDMRMSDGDGNPDDNSMKICHRKIDLSHFYIYSNHQFIPYNDFTNEECYLEVKVVSKPK